VSSHAGLARQRFPLARGAAILLLVLGAIALGLWSGGWRVRAFIAGQTDLGSYFIPKYQYAADRIAAGELPLWNPYEFGGIPFLATIQPGVFYPPIRLAYAVLSGEQAHLLLFAMHVLIAALGALLFARELGLSLWPAIFAAAWVTQPIWLVRIYDHPILLAAASWIPLLLLLSRRVIHAPTARDAALLGLVAALQAVSGYPPLVLATAYLLLLGLPFWMLDRDPATPAAPPAHVVAAFVAAGTIAALLAAAQILPTIELALLTDRAADAEQTRARLAGLAKLNDATLVFMGIPLSSFRSTWTELWNRCGPFLLIPALIAPLLRPRSKPTWFALAATVLTAGLPAWVYASLPLAGLIRFGFEWIFMAAFAVYLLAALGLDALLARSTRARVLAAPLTLVVLGCATFTGFRHVDPRYFAVDVGTPPPVPDVSSMCDLDDPMYRSFWAAGHLRGSLMHQRIRSIGGYEQSLLPRRLAHLQKQLGIGNGMVLPLWAQSLAESSALASRHALRCVLTSSAPVLETGGFVAQPPVSGPYARVYVNPAARPRVRLEHDVRRAASADEALALVRVAPASGVVLEGTPADDAAAAPCATSGRDRVEILGDAPEDVRIRTRSDCASYLVLADTLLPGWSASVDGVPAPIIAADYAFRAVRLEAGEHEVEFTYRAPGLTAGILLSLLGLAGTALLVVRGRRGTSPGGTRPTDL